MMKMSWWPEDPCVDDDVVLDVVIRHRDATVSNLRWWWWWWWWWWQYYRNGCPPQCPFWWSATAAPRQTPQHLDHCSSNPAVNDRFKLFKNIAAVNLYHSHSFLCQVDLPADLLHWHASLWGYPGRHGSEKKDWRKFGLERSSRKNWRQPNVNEARRVMKCEKSRCRFQSQLTSRSYSSSPRWRGLYSSFWTQSTSSLDLRSLHCLVCPKSLKLVNQMWIINL